MSKLGETLKAKRKGKPKGTKDRRHLKAQEARILERRNKVLSLRVAGWTQDEIAKECACSVPTVAADIRAVLQETVLVNAETAEELRHIQGARLDQIVKGHLEYASEPHKAVAVDRRTGKTEIVEMPPSASSAQIVLQTEQRRAKLFGLDVPETKTVRVQGIREYAGVDMDKI